MNAGHYCRRVVVHFRRQLFLPEIRNRDDIKGSLDLAGLERNEKVNTYGMKNERRAENNIQRTGRIRNSQEPKDKLGRT